MSEPAYAWLLEEHLLRCTACGSDQFTADAKKITCSTCNKSVGIAGGVPDFYGSYKTAVSTHHAASSSPTTVIVTDILEQLVIPDQPETRAAVESALERGNRAADDHAISAEIQELHGRFAAGSIQHPATPENANTEPNASLERHYVPPALVSGERRTINVRLRNDGDFWWSSRIEPKLRTATCLTPRRRAGNAVTTTTDLPIDVKPGRSITLPLGVSVPERSGHYQLTFGLFQAPVGFISNSTFQVDVSVRRRNHRGTRPIPNIVRQSTVGFGYGDDHIVANEIVAAALERLRPDGHRRILEIGGSVHPQSWDLERSSLVNLDISAPTLELGVLYDRYHDRSIAHLCADALAPPLALNAWDAVVMYATLHHFAEPEQLLRTARELIKPDGFVAIMCEPRSDTLDSEATVTDLLKGINEQTFRTDEYLWMIDQAGLRVERSQVDDGSFKAIAVPC